MSIKMLTPNTRVANDELAELENESMMLNYVVRHMLSREQLAEYKFRRHNLDKYNLDNGVSARVNCCADIDGSIIV